MRSENIAWEFRGKDTKPCPSQSSEEIKKWADWKENDNPFAGREDERSCHCNDCEADFREGEIVCNGGKEKCPSCGKEGCIADGEENDPDF